MPMLSSRRVLALSLAALLAGCSSIGSKDADVSASRASSGRTVSNSSIGDQCAGNRSRCLYNGAYESGERDYAEQEARKLNLAELERLKRGFGQ